MARSELARVAEIAWQQSMDKGRDFKDIMQHVADAVVAAYLVQDPPELNHYIALMKENEAVIKAAKVWTAVCRAGRVKDSIPLAQTLSRAVEALQEVEGE